MGLAILDWRFLIGDLLPLLYARYARLVRQPISPRQSQFANQERLLLQKSVGLINIWKSSLISNHCCILLCGKDGTCVPAQTFN
jgi:hypothetical protein